MKRVFIAAGLIVGTSHVMAAKPMTAEMCMNYAKHMGDIGAMRESGMPKATALQSAHTVSDQYSVESVYSLPWDSAEKIRVWALRTCADALPAD